MTESLPIVEGDTEEIALHFFDEDGNDVDITGWTLFLTVKSSTSDSDGDAVHSDTLTTHNRPLEGRSTFVMTDSDTEGMSGTYTFDIQYKKPDGTIKTPVNGVIYVTEDVTNRTS